jgi:hypothetical protein
MELLIIGLIAVAFLLSQKFHNKADDVRLHEEVRADSRNEGRKTEKIFFAILGFAIVLYLTGTIGKIE